VAAGFATSFISVGAAAEDDDDDEDDDEEEAEDEADDDEEAEDEAEEEEGAMGLRRVGRFREKVRGSRLAICPYRSDTGIEVSVT